MSDDHKSGSDLDIFEALGKKSAGRVSGGPPSPPSSSEPANVPAAAPTPVSEQPPQPPTSTNTRAEMKRTLVGIPGPAQPPSQASRAYSSIPPPPPPTSQGRVSAPPPPDRGRGTLPNLLIPNGSSTIPAAQTLPSMPAPDPLPNAVGAVGSSGELDAASGADSELPPSMPIGAASTTETLADAFGALGQPREPNSVAQLKSGGASSLRSAPPPPPTSMRAPHPAPIPPPPPPGQTTTVSHASAPPISPIGRATKPPVVVPRQQSRAGLIIGVVAALAIAGFFLVPRTGTLVVNVAGLKGGAISSLEVTVDEKKVCDSAPCIVRDVPSGVHQVKVSAQGFDSPAPRAVTVESRKDLTLDFSLPGDQHGSAAAGPGTGFKVSGNQAGVRLLVDGKERGPLPQEVRDLSAGEHKIRIFGGDRYVPLEKTVLVKQDEVQDLGSVQLKVFKGKTTLQLGTPGAKVFLINGATRKEVPQFPIAIDFDPNEHWQLEAKMPGMNDYTTPISFDDGQAEKTINVTLSPRGTSAANAPGAGHPSRSTPALTPAKPEAAAGAGEAFLNINSKPASTVLLDGTSLGPTPRLKVPVTPGTHTVLFVNAEESLKKSVAVTVAAGETKPVIGKLRD